MAFKLLSIVIPSYNMEKYLPKCLGSLVVDDAGLLQTLEVLVVNDGSKDKTSEIAHEFATRHPDVFRVIDKPNGNYGSCINVALPLATGLYVKILDADDYVDTRGLERSLDVLSAEAQKGDFAVDLLVTSYDQVDENGDRTALFDYGLGPEGHKTFADVSCGTSRFTIHSIAYKLANVRRIGYRQTEGVSYTDTEWIIDPMVTVRRFYYLPIVVTHYLVGRAGQTMEAATFARKFQQVADVTLNIASRYDRMLDLAHTEAVAYYKRQVMWMISFVYRVGVFGWGGVPAVCDLVNFDLRIKEIPELYASGFETAVDSRLFKFHYIAEWRRHHTTHTLRYFLFHAYETFVHARLRLKNVLFATKCRSSCGRGCKS